MSLHSCTISTIRVQDTLEATLYYTRCFYAQNFLYSFFNFPDQHFVRFNKSVLSERSTIYIFIKVVRTDYRDLSFILYILLVFY